MPDIDCRGIMRLKPNGIGVEVDTLPATSPPQACLVHQNLAILYTAVYLSWTQSKFGDTRICFFLFFS